MNRRQRRCRAKCRRTSRAEAAAKGSGQADRPCWLPNRLAAEVLAEVGDRIALARLWAGVWWHEHKRPTEWWGSSLMLLVAVVSAVFTAYAALRPTPSPGFSFKAGVSEGSGGLRSFAVPEPGDPLAILLQLTPRHQDVRGVAVTISPPRRVELTQRCYYTVGDSPRRECAMPGGEGRIDVAQINSGETLRITVEARVVTRIEDRETIAIEMSSAEAEASQRAIDLFSPEQGEEDRRSAVQESDLSDSRA